MAEGNPRRTLWLHQLFTLLEVVARIVEEPLQGGYWPAHGGGTLGLRTSSSINTRGIGGSLLGRRSSLGIELSLTVCVHWWSIPPVGEGHSHKALLATRELPHEMLS